MKFISTLLICFLAFPAFAQTRAISGQSAPAFQQALSAWLNGEDLPALEAFSELAKNNNAAAQILLARIARRPNMYAHVTVDMDRKEKIALLRKPGGLSGKSWLTEAQKREPLAAAFLKSERQGDKAAAMSTLFEHGEPQSAILAGMSLVNQGNAEPVIEILAKQGNNLTLDAYFLAQTARQMIKSQHGRYVGSANVFGSSLSAILSNRLHLEWHAPTLPTMLENPEVRKTTAELSQDIESWTPLRNFCTQACSQSAKTCTALGASLMVLHGSFPMRSPVQSIVSNETYWESERI